MSIWTKTFRFIAAAAPASPESLLSFSMAMRISTNTSNDLTVYHYVAFDNECQFYDQIFIFQGKRQKFMVGENIDFEGNSVGSL